MEGLQALSANTTAPNLTRGRATDTTKTAFNMPANRVVLPTYAFQHQHYWLQPATATQPLTPTPVT
jgi:acyl transferase domain-containing protein